MQTETRYCPTNEESATLARVLADVAGAGRLRAEDARDFIQSVHLHLIETDYDLLRRFRGRSALRTYLIVAVRRLLIDWRNQMYGRWRPSVTALRLGPPAVELERLMYRDGWTRDEAVELASGQKAAAEETDMARLADALPPRARRQRVPDTLLEEACAPQGPDPLEDREHRHTRRRVFAALRDAVDGLSREDRRILYMRFHEGRTIRSVAGSLRAEPRPMYRRVAGVLADLRTKLGSVSPDEARTASGGFNRASAELHLPRKRSTMAF